MHGISEFKYEFVIVNLDDPSNVISVPVELPALPAKAQLFGVGPTVATMTDLSDSFFYFYLSTWRTTYVGCLSRVCRHRREAADVVSCPHPLPCAPPVTCRFFYKVSGQGRITMVRRGHSWRADPS